MHREVLLSAHYDSKTELFDHLERALLFVATALTAVAGIALARRRPRLARGLGLGVSLGLGLGGLHFGSSLWIEARGHGIVDDAVACALLVEEASRLHELPLESTRVRCIWWAAEELGAQASSSYARASGLRPAAVVNLECLGAGPRTRFGGLEWTGRGFSPPDPQLVASLERARGVPLERLPAPVVTDAGGWLRVGIAAVTLLNVRADGLPAPDLHGPRDRLDAVDYEGVDDVRGLLDAWLADLDSERPPS